MKLIQPVIDALQGSRRKPTIILFVSPLLLLFWKYCCTPEIWAGCFAESGRIHPQTLGTICHFVSCFFLLGVVPALIVKFVFNERLCDFGIRIGDGVRTVRSFLVCAPFLLVFAYLGTQNSAMVNHYPINQQASQSAAMFALHAGTFFLYFVGWEFYFRGFMLIGLRESIGDVNAVLIQTLASALLHIGSPAPEAFGAVAGGILWGVFALRTRSLLSGLSQHFLLAITVDWLICYG